MLWTQEPVFDNQRRKQREFNLLVIYELSQNEFREYGFGVIIIGKWDSRVWQQHDNTGTVFDWMEVEVEVEVQ